MEDILSIPSLEMYQGTKENFIQRAKRSAFSTFAVLKDSIWYETEPYRTEFSTTFDEKATEHWDNVVNGLIDRTSGNTLLSMCTCHC